MIHFIHRAIGVIDVLHGATKIGELGPLDDGFWAFWPEVSVWSNGGCVMEHVLRAIADKLDELNDPVRKHLDAEFNKVNGTGEEV